MTLKSAYREIMDQVEVTEEMRERILDGVEKKRGAQKAGRRRYIRSGLSLAACLALVLLGTAVVPQLFDGGTEEPPQEQTTVANGMEDVDSASALSDKVGFEVQDLTGLPFAAEHITYTSLWGETAQITYEGENQTVTYRKAPGEEDISGDYNVYDTVTETVAGETAVTLKGDGDRYVLALWTADGYSYALSLENPVTEEQIIKILEANF
ncbi:MAG: hypothetical protein MSA81_12845 [Roseburia hominis]|nr:hypothetical protein [Roseburia hominis]